MEEIKLYRCNICGNLVMVLNDSGVTPHCCGTEMEYLKVNTEDGVFEKHMPVVTLGAGWVQADVGNVLHPMKENHYIEWIAALTDSGLHIRELKPGDRPGAGFMLNGENLLSVYAFCNIHGLWMNQNYLKEDEGV